MEIQQGLMLSLKCRVQGERDPDIRWYKDGQLIDPEKNPNVEISVAVKRSRLRVKNVQLGDSGNYSCIGSSQNAELSRWVYVTVLPNTDERKAADEKAYSPCPVNVCNVGRCLIIDNEPVCRCPPTHSGPKCSEKIFNEPSSAAPMILVTPTQDANLGEEDFILDQSPAGASSSQLTPVTKMTDRCQLPEFQNSPECTQVNSHLYAFVGAAIVCSLVILLLGSCLGYIRRRKLLNRHLQAVKKERLHAETDTVDISCNPEIQDSTKQHGSCRTGQQSPLFARTYAANSQTIYTPIKRGPSLVTPSLQAGINTPNGADGKNLIDCSLNSGLNPTFVVLTSAAPLNIHPVSNFLVPGTITHSQSSTNYMNHNFIPRSAGTLITDLTGAHTNGIKYIPLAHSPLIPTKSMSPSTRSQIIPETRMQLESMNLPCSSSACGSKQIYIQIPALSPPIYLNTLNPLEKQIQSNTYAMTKDIILGSTGSENILQPPIKDSLIGNSPPTVSGVHVYHEWDHLQSTSPSNFGPDCVPVTMNFLSLSDPKHSLTRQPQERTHSNCHVDTHC